jgi:serine/threonine protein kinase
MIQLKSKPIEDDYMLNEIIWRGKNATVYRATQKKGGLNRAIKVIKKIEESERLSSRFVNEAFILKSLVRLPLNLGSSQYFKMF